MRGRTHHRGQGHRPGPARPGPAARAPTQRSRGGENRSSPPPPAGARLARPTPTLAPLSVIRCTSSRRFQSHAKRRPWPSARTLSPGPTGRCPSHRPVGSPVRARGSGSEPRSSDPNPGRNGPDKAGPGRAGQPASPGPRAAGAARSRPWRCRQARKIGRRRRVADLSDRLGGPTPGRPGPGGPSCLLGAVLPLLRPGRSDRRRRRRRQKRRRRRSTSATQTKTAAASRLNIMSPGAASRNDMSHRA